jgi:hypothetical protein
MSRWSYQSTRIYKPDGTDKVQSAEARGEALHQVPSAMQRLQQTKTIHSALHNGDPKKKKKKTFCVPACNRVVAEEKEIEGKHVSDSCNCPIPKEGRGG